MVKLTLIQGDCLKVLPTLEDESVDLVLTDPPYNISQSKNFRNKDGSVGFKGWNPVFEDWDAKSPEEFKNFNQRWINECSRILKKDGSIYIFGNYQSIFDIGFVFKAKFRILNLISWFKYDAFPNDYQHSRYVNSTEFILFGDKGKHNFNSKKPIRDNITLSKSIKQKYHPTEKPLEIIERFIKLSSDENNTVLDCFLGSGTTMKVARDLKRNCIGIEIEPEYIEFCKKRLNWGSSLSDKIEWEFKINPI